MKKILLTSLFVFITFVTIAPKQAQAEDNDNFFSRSLSFLRRQESSQKEKNHNDDENERDDDRKKNERGHKKHGRSPHKDDTIVAGTIYDGSHNPVNGDKDFEKVTVTCNGVTKIGDIGSNGGYSVSFKKSQCNEGDSVTTSAVTEQGSGSNSTTVYDDPDEGPCGDTDVTVLDVSVPEFGMVAGTFTALASVVGYLKLRAK